MARVKCKKCGEAVHVTLGAKPYHKKCMPEVEIPKEKPGYNPPPESGPDKPHIPPASPKKKPWWHIFIPRDTDSYYPHFM